MTVDTKLESVPPIYAYYAAMSMQPGNQCLRNDGKGDFPESVLSAF
jgi:hypothetical protein